MEISYAVGDATRPAGSGRKMIVHVCNDIGGWGRGFVGAISRCWREPERCYRAWYRGEDSLPFELGQVQFVKVEDDLWVANLIGQHGIQRRGGEPPVRYAAIRAGLRRVAEQALTEQASIHMPRIGCGLAGGRWEEVSALLEQELVARGISVTVYDQVLAPG